MARPSSFFGPTCESMHAIDLAWIRRQSGMRAGYRGTVSWSRGDSRTGAVGYQVLQDGLRLMYRITDRDGIRHEFNEVIPFVSTSTKFGGRRAWFRCPSCNRRCRIVYGGQRFRCRRCMGLRYASQHEPAYQRSIDKADRIRRRLGDDRGKTFEGHDFPDKPKRMRWATYRRLRGQYGEATNWTAGMVKRFGLFKGY